MNSNTVNREKRIKSLMHQRGYDYHTAKLLILEQDRKRKVQLRQVVQK